MSTSRHAIPHTRRAPAAGFSLIELLIVVGILGLLSAVLLPTLLETGETAKIQQTQTLLQATLAPCIEEFKGSLGYYPPDDLRPREPDAKTSWKADNGRNTGGESLLVFLGQTTKFVAQLQPVARVNTDNDTHGANIKAFDTSDRMEFADAWGTPIVYFEKTNMDKPQLVVPGEDLDAVKVVPKKREDNVVLGRNSFQLLSAGPDRTFGTADDISWPDN
jgi:prepilin-type N-terminal cleavage/methylation domain-containing protein